MAVVGVAPHKYKGPVFDDEKDPTPEPIFYIRQVSGCSELEFFAFHWAKYHLRNLGDAIELPARQFSEVAFNLPRDHQMDQNNILNWLILWFKGMTTSGEEEDSMAT